MSSEIMETTLSAAQASISVLLILAYGMAAEKYNILTHEGEKNISHLGVTLFLPALLFSEIGPQASLSNLASYWIIIVLAIWFQLLSYLAAIILRRLFNLPQWIVPCLIFNNVTSLPLLLFSSLEAHGALDKLAVNSEPISALASRARSYILLHALVCNLTRFLLGPALMSPKSQIDHIFSHHESPHVSKPITTDAPTNASLPLPIDPERHPLLHHPSGTSTTTADRVRSKRIWTILSSWINPPLLGGIAAIIVGATPFLHNLLLSPDSPLSTTFTHSIHALGKLYTVLQMFVLGGQLYSKRGSRADWGGFALITVWRFAVMPCASISTVYFLRKVTARGGIVDSDPVMDFVLAIVPVGPPAITLAAIADLSDISSEAAGSIDRTLMYSYIVTPLISLPISAVLTVVKQLHGIE